MQKIIAKLEELLDVESINENDLLENFEDWDSLSIISFIAFLDKEYSVNLYTNELQQAKTIKDLLQLIKDKQDEQRK
ncbi:acyl carrier protein [Helicobacter muridarum]|uniref:Acyl carrier protein n=1 Tax=Helicobacter muridarum TaxID=216 RepID=A0A377PSQ4_9HELI|nr:acyl carrier protein [Helicobacter muridarum]TLD98684.1 acyl carrier protein [Helicobacter muridarum]STQ85560.1 acyl carrier protein [Helicobacter muridarum]